MSVLSELTEFSNFYGKNNELVLAGGGNTSAKDENIMYIKGSGTSLATIKENDFVAMNRQALSDIFNKSYSDDDKKREEEVLADMMAAKLENQEKKRPSVETLLHSLFRHRYVLHLHPALINGLTCSENGEVNAYKLFGNDVIWIGICRPGYILAKLCKDKMDEFKEKNGKDAEIVLLENHGIFFAADTPNDLGKMLEEAMNKVRSAVKGSIEFDSRNCSDDKINVINKLENLYGEGSKAVHDNSETAFEFSENESKLRGIMKPFTPDHIVYCKAFPLYVKDISKLENDFLNYERENGYKPKAIVIKGNGVFTVGKDRKDAETAQLLMRDAMKIAFYSENFGGPLPMTDELIDFIVNWEAEAYRSKG